MFSEQDKPEQRQTFQIGANYDESAEKIFSPANSGFYIDGHNVQPVSNDGNTGDLEKIKGEVLLYPNARNDFGYRCVASDFVNNNLVEVWAPDDDSQPGIIRVDGQVVLSSTNFKISPLFPPQWDVNNSSVNGEICITDKKQPPFVFNIQDMVDNIGNDKYFDAFDPKLYQVNIQSALDIPVFVDLIDVGGGGGLPVGQYQYQMRFSSESGDRTNWSHPTPMIPVFRSYNSDSLQFPYIKTYGDDPNPSSVTSLAPKIRFRVTNLYDYDYIEIKRISYNNGAGIEQTSNGRIVARIQVTPGEISVREYIDPQESNVDVVLSVADETRQLAYIETAGSVRYNDRRLVFSNITYPSRSAELTFLELNGKQGFPVIDKINKEGMCDAWNHTYRKSEMRGEKAGFAVNLYDSVGNSGWAQKIPQLKDYQFPNRRDAASSETQNYSRNGLVKAALTNSTNGVGLCHEVFDLANPVSKTNFCDFKNIVENGRVTGATGTKTTSSTSGVNWDCNETDPEIENHGANVSTLNLVSVSYQPFTPVNQNDPNVTGHNYVTNTKVAVANINVGPIPIENGSVKNYRPEGFSPNYYSMGMAVTGIADFPEWAKSFAIVRTESANRVVAQGLAYYSLIKGAFKAVGDSNLGGKETRKFWVYSPDIENGIVSSDTVNDMIANPAGYKIQFVSPLGFFSEWFSAEDKLSLISAEKDRCIDMISYVRMISDVAGDGAQINPGEDPNMGIDGGDGRRYVAYDKFRNNTIIPSTFSGDPNGGNKIVDIASITRKAEGRGTYLELQVNEDIYASVFTGGLSESQFENNGLKNWTEPVYMINIVRTGAQVNDNDLEKYRQTTHYQKLESIIGKSTGAPDQSFLLVDERWEDCIPSSVNGQFGYNTDRFVYIKATDGSVQKWANVTYYTNSQKSSLQASISAGIGDISGMYTHTGTERAFQIVFNQPGFYPPEGALILVRYDNTAPIRVFGGDTFIGETIFAPIDGQASARDNAAETQFALGIGLPYKDFKINPRYYTIRKAGANINVVQDKEWFSLGFIRQLCVMFTVEARSAIHLAHNNDYPNQYYPLINYVIRPNRWDPDKSYEDNEIFSDYRDDYGDNEKSQWKWGGFRFLQQINPDYSIQPPISFFSRPQIGFEEKLSFPTRIMWSLPRQINVQSTPSIKTFPANNSFDLDDNQGDVKYLWSATTGAGENLYAFAEKGICMPLTKKSILSDLGANQLGVIASDQFIGGQYWWSRDIGIPDMMWRSVAEASIPTEAGDTKRALFFTNYLSVYRFMDNEARDIAGKYYGKIYKEGISKVRDGVGTKMCSVFDLYKNQLYVHFEDAGLQKTFVYGQETGTWYGTNGFTFDKFTSYNGETYGHRDMLTYKLNEGYLIDGFPIESKVIHGFAPESDKDKEFIRIRVNSSKRPVHVKFYKQFNGPVQCLLSAISGPLYLKNYRGWENYVPRISASVDANRNRFQGRIIICEIMHNLAESFVINDVTMQYKKLI